MIIKPMSLYTPVEIPKSRLEEMAKVRPYSIQKYEGNPFQESKSSVESLTDQKKRIIHWLRSMSVLERQDKFAFSSKDFVTLLRIMYEKRRRHSDRSFRITEEAESRKLTVFGKENAYRLENADVDDAEEELLKNVVIISSKALFDSVSLSEPILKNLDKLFEVFEVVEDGVSNELSVEEYRALDKEGSEAYFYRKDETDHYKKTLGKWLIEVLKKKLWCEYYRNLEEPAQSRRTRERKRFNKAWKELPPTKKREFVRLCRYSELHDFVSRERLSERIRPEILPQLRIPSEPEFEEFLHYLVNNNDLEIFEYLTQCTLEEACQSIHLIKFPLLYTLLEHRKAAHSRDHFKNTQQSTVQNKKKRMKPKRRKTDKASSQLEKSTTTLNVDTIDKKSQHPSTPPKVQTKQQNRKEPKTQTKQYKTEAVKVEHRTEPKVVKQPNQKSENQGNNNGNSLMGTPPQKNRKNKKYVEADHPLKDLGKAKSCTSNETNQTAHRQQQLTQEQLQTRRNLIQDIYKQKQKNDIVQVADSISEIANSYQPYRITAFNRIQYLLSHWGVSIKIFGSCATGLALANSDIDLAVDLSILNYFYAVFGTTKDKVCMALGNIMKMIENRGWVSNIKLITTASVPILKFEINPNIPFEQDPKSQYLNIKEKQKGRKVLVKVDLTIESFYSAEDSSTSNHLGIMATNSMKEWMRQYPALHNVSIILKDLLKRRDLNNIYKGGISSYSLIVMVIAFLHAKGLTEERDPSVVFYGFLEFLCQEFDHQRLGFDISHNNPTFPFFTIETPLTGKVQVKDPLNGKVVTCNSYQYDKILQEFETIWRCRLRARQDLQKYIANPCMRLPDKGKYFTRNYLQEYLAGTT